MYTCSQFMMHGQENIKSLRYIYFLSYFLLSFSQPVFLTPFILHCVSVSLKTFYMSQPSLFNIFVRKSVYSRQQSVVN